MTSKRYGWMKRGGGSQILVPDTWEECKNWKLEDTNEPDIYGKVSDLGNRDRRPRRERGHRGDAEDLSQGGRENDIS